MLLLVCPSRLFLFINKNLLFASGYRYPIWTSFLRLLFEKITLEFYGWMDGVCVYKIVNISLYVCNSLLLRSLSISVIIDSMYIWRHTCPRPHSTEHTRFIGTLKSITISFCHLTDFSF